ncbi:histone deacetylase family protein [Thalassolituus oleivorans]|jgi:histone deacetylase 11|uniref:histone deacetylase family protein n=1 Tax=Thalassolituus oleivorans TaxID=187493 RepID=UPI0023F4B093|nr:histone deacetylase [Thalassolituus oleivorans]
MKIIYNSNFNIDLGVLKYLHPFDGMKFCKIHDELAASGQIEFASPEAPIDIRIVDEFLSSVMRHRVRNKNGIMQALEIPRVPFLSYSYLDKNILTPMRWGGAGTLFGAKKALDNGGVYWNLSGGYHHAMPQNMEGFCIYNDIGICYQQLLEQGHINQGDRILIIDTDAHHGNGNAHTFMDNPSIVLLDIYNASIYPVNEFTRERVDIPMKLKSGTDGETYLECLKIALSEIVGEFKLAFVVAGTDVLAVDKLGGLKLTADDVAERERLTLSKLAELNIPAVITGGGGYSSESASAVAKAILSVAGS